MVSIYDDSTDGSSFVWTIQNFSYCLHKPGEYLESPSFDLDINTTDRWRLRMYPRGVNGNNSSDLKRIGFRLHLEKTSTSHRTAEFTLSIRNIRGIFEKANDLKHEFSRSEAWGSPNFMKKRFREEGIETFIDNDTMTLRCRIWKVDDKSLPSDQYYMRTIINVERATNIWSLEKFRPDTSDELTTKLRMSLEMQSLMAVNLISYRQSFSGDRIKLEIKQIDGDKQCLFTCDITLLDTSEKVIHSVREKHRFVASGVLQVWTLPYIPPIKICDYKNTYLRCELAVSSGSDYSLVERVENGQIDHQTTSSSLKNEHNFADSWKDDLMCCYLDGVFTDVTIRTPSKEFPVHKAILCARSTVFRAMFERDMKENRTGVVHIEDIDADTVHKMLLFVYSDVVEDLDSDVASKLYFAADKYRITALKRRSSDFLKENLSVSNVCEVTVLANMHQDEDLKSFAQDFIMEHAAEVMLSGEWTKFKQDNVHLHSEMMDALFLRKLNISK